MQCSLHSRQVLVRTCRELTDCHARFRGHARGGSDLARVAQAAHGQPADTAAVAQGIRAPTFSDQGLSQFPGLVRPAGRLRGSLRQEADYGIRAPANALCISRGAWRHKPCRYTRAVYKWT